MFQTDVIIVNWNSGVLLEACLRSLVGSNLANVSQVIVVDNDSNDGSANLDFPDLPLTIIKTGANLGFGKACNLGAAHGSADCILFLNPDTEVFENTISAAVSSMAATEMRDVGVVGVRMADRQGRTLIQCARFPKWSTFVNEALGLTHIFPRRFRSTQLTEFDHETTADVDHVIGAFYLVRRRIFENVGGFDERFFVYFEDLDLSRRISEQGWRIRYLSGPVAYHRQGGTSDQIKGRRLAYALEGRFNYARKHFPAPERLVAQFVMLFIEPFTRTAFSLFRRSPSDVLSIWYGYSLFVKSMLLKTLTKKNLH